MNKFKVVHVSDLHFGLSTFGVDNPETSLNRDSVTKVRIHSTNLREISVIRSSVVNWYNNESE